MKLKLKKLTLVNFKGLRSQALECEGDTNVFAANELGKSTLYTAYVWLLTGKDEFDRKDYEIKNTKHHELNVLPHEVEGIFDIDNSDLKLRRAFIEKWEKPKGQPAKVFKGHKTEFWVNDVPCNETEYQKKVNEIINLGLLKLITNPTYFNTMNWQDQRRGLLSIAGEISNAEVIDSIASPDNDYASLISVLNSGKSLEDWKKQIAAKKALLKKEAVEFVPRIDELKRSLPEPKDFAAIEKKIAVVSEEIAKIDTLRADASKSLAERQKGVLAKQRTLHQKQTELSNIRYKIKSDIQQQQNEAGSKINSIQLQIREVNALIQQMERQRDENSSNIAAYQNMIEEKYQAIASLRCEWDEINREVFHFDDSSCQCPTCKQMLPAGDIEKQKADLQKNFNDSVARRKKSRFDESVQVKAEIKQLQDKIDHINSLGDSWVGIQFEQKKLDNLKMELQKLQQAEAQKGVLNMDVAVDAMIKVNADALNLTDEISALELQIKTETEALESSNGTDYTARKQQLADQVRELDRELSMRNSIDHTNKRISELEMEERVNAQAIADIEQQEFDIESFTRAKMDILEERVNSMFRYVKFRLFEKLVNGGIDETCVCEYKGVPYPTLNTAAKTLCGLDVINTFCKLYKVYAPIFCDNRESVTFIPECESQVISLFVSPSDKQLRIEPVNKHQLELV